MNPITGDVTPPNRSPSPPPTLSLPIISVQSVPDHQSASSTTPAPKRSRYTVEVINNVLYIDGQSANKKELAFMDLSDANLSGAHLRGAELNWTDLCGIDMSGAQLNGAKMRAAKLISTNLSGVNLHKAFLYQTNFLLANFFQADLRKTNLNEANLRHANLSYAKLNNANLSYAKLNNAKLNDAKLNWAKLDEADLTGADFSQADLTGADLISVKLTRADFTNAILTNATITFKQYDFLNNPGQIDLQLNHINNPSGSLLNTINTIDDQYIDLKINLLHQLIEQLASVDLTAPTFPRQAFIEAIASNAAYLADNKIRDFMTPLIDHEITTANSAPSLINNAHDAVPAGILYFIKARCEAAGELGQTNQQRYMIDNNGAFMQLIARYAYLQTDSTKNIARNLYNQYLGLPKVTKIANNWMFEGMSENGTLAWHDKSYVNLIFVKEEHGLMMSHEILEKMFKNDVEAWNQCCYFANGENQPQEQQTLFTEIFPVFANHYCFTQNSATFQKLLLTLNLGNYYAGFSEALTKKSLSEDKKLIHARHQDKLAEIFSQVMENCDKTDPVSVIDNFRSDARKVQFQDKHFQAILEAFHLKEETPQGQAHTLFALATIFSRYSASSLFGTELESPQALRNYAYALLAKARALDPTVFAADAPLCSFKDIKARLLGLDSAFTCMAILSTDMAAHARHNFSDIYNRIVPPAWA